MKFKIASLLIPVSLAVLSGCSFNMDNVLPDKSVEYKKEKEAGRNLEVPPDLTTSSINDKFMVPDTPGGGSATYSGLADQGRRREAQGAYGSHVLPKIRNVQVERDGDERWLLIAAPPEAVWPKVVDFWQQNGIILKEQDPTLGTMRTSWLENRADIKSDFITDAVRSVFEGAYEAGTRDQYRVRLERGQAPGTTELYLTHYGMEEQIATGTNQQSENAVWVPRKRDPQLEAEMLRRIMIHLGIEDQKARTQLAAAQQPKKTSSKLVKGRGGASGLLIEEPFSRAWRVTGLALDRVGFAVEDRDRSAGIYYVRYNDPAASKEDEGWLSKLAFWDSGDDTDKNRRYQVFLKSGERGTLVTVRNDKGQREDSPTALRILTLIHEQLH